MGNEYFKILYVHIHIFTPLLAHVRQIAQICANIVSFSLLPAWGWFWWALRSEVVWGSDARAVPRLRTSILT